MIPKVNPRHLHTLLDINSTAWIAVEPSRDLKIIISQISAILSNTTGVWTVRSLILTLYSRGSFYFDARTVEKDELLSEESSEVLD